MFCGTTTNPRSDFSSSFSPPATAANNALAVDRYVETHVDLLAKIIKQTSFHLILFSIIIIFINLRTKIH